MQRGACQPSITRIRAADKIGHHSNAATVISSATATGQLPEVQCHRPMSIISLIAAVPLPVPPVVFGVGLAARSTAAITANHPAAAQLCWKWVHPSSIRTFHMPDLSPMLDRLCVRRLYVCYVDRLEHHLVLLLDWVVGARLVEDAAGGR